jgi:spoIIIJ-associated protein
MIDVEGYQQRRHQSLENMARRVARRVTDTGRSITLEPMPANERRIVHLALSDHPRVMTESTGFGDSRQVTVQLR